MKIGVVGNGNWGTTVAKLVAENVRSLENVSDEVVLWVYEEVHEGTKLSDEINHNHRNPKYLPGVALPKNIVARTEMDFEDIDVLLFCLPHQFVEKLKDARLKQGVHGVNLCKGLIVFEDGLETPSCYISRMLNIECSCLMGANIANEVAHGVLSDATVGYASLAYKELIRSIFEGDYFRVECKPYNKGLEIAGAVKNIISLAVGMCDGRGWGKNTLAMIFRKGLLEMQALCQEMGSDLDFIDSACIGDCLVSCLCGRNYKCGVAIGKTGVSVEDYEKSMNGQKLQGPSTAAAVVKLLKKKGISKRHFPIFFTVNSICSGDASPDTILEILRTV